MVWTRCLLLAILFGVIAGQEFVEQPAGAILRQGQNAYKLDCYVRGLAGAGQTVSYRLGTTVFSDDGFIRADAVTSLGLDLSRFLISIIPYNETHRKVELYVRNFGAEQVGDYTCLVCRTVNLLCDESNVILVSQPATLQIARQPDPSVPTCSTDSGSTQVYLGESLTLTCQAGSAVPAVELTWQQDGRPVATTSVTSDNAVTRATKTLTAESDLDGATFTCHLNYTYQPTDTALPPEVVLEMCSLAPLNVVSEPVVAIEASDPIAVGSQAVFTCVVSSSTSTFAGNAIVWTGLDTIDESRYSVSVGSQRSVLTVDPVQSGDHGTSLTCSATDEDGITGSGSQQLLITGRPPPVTDGPTVSTSPSSKPAAPLGAIIAGVLCALILLVLICLLVLWYCRRQQQAKPHKKQWTGGHYPMSNHHTQAMPDKTANHTGSLPADGKEPGSPLVGGKDYPDQNGSLGNPDVVPREKREGRPDGVDPRDWWRESVPPADDVPYERCIGTNDYPTIKGMKMPFQDRTSPYPGSNPGSDRGYQRYDSHNAADHRYEDLHRPDDYDYDNDAYERSTNSQLDQPDPYNDQYGDGYNDQYDDRPHDQYSDHPNDQYNDQPYDQYNDRYDDRPDEHYNDQYDDGRNDQYSDQPAGQYDDRYDARPEDHYDDRYNDNYDDGYGDRYESYGHPDGQEEYSMAADGNGDYYPKYDQDERIPDGHSSSTDQYPAAPYDDSYKAPYDDHLSDPHGYSQSYPDKQAYNESLHESQDTPSYV